jgi:hypothetical protein
MDKSTIPTANRELQERVQKAIDHWINPCFTKPYEHIIASANDQGEVYLYGLVEDGYKVDEAMWLVKSLPAVRFVFNLVTVIYNGKPVRV